MSYAYRRTANKLLNHVIGLGMPVHMTTNYLLPIWNDYVHRKYKQGKKVKLLTDFMG